MFFFKSIYIKLHSGCMYDVWCMSPTFLIEEAVWGNRHENINWRTDRFRATYKIWDWLEASMHARYTKMWVVSKCQFEIIRKTQGSTSRIAAPLGPSSSRSFQRRGSLQRRSWSILGYKSHRSSDLLSSPTPGMPSPNLGRGTLLVDGYSSSYDDVSELGHLI